MQYNLYLSALLIAATCCTLIISYLSWNKREVPIARSYGLGMLVSAFYSIGYAFEIISANLEHIRFWLRIEYIGISFATVFWGIMVLQYTGRQAWLSRKVVAWLMVSPTITYIAHLTNEWHHLFYTSMTIEEWRGMPLVVLVKGPLYYIHVVFAYSIFVIGMLMLIQMFMKATPRMKKQIAFMIIGSWGPYGFTLVYLSGLSDMPIDLSPFGFVLSGVFYMWGIYQFNMLRLAPLASQKVFESMQDAVIILDMDNILTSYNQSAERIIGGLNKSLIGQPADRILTQYPELLAKTIQNPSVESRVRLLVSEAAAFYNVHLFYFNNKNQKPVGKALLLSDVTEMVISEEKVLENARKLSELNTFKDKMFNVVAHDIRDPLAVLINLMELMEEEIHAQGESPDEIVLEMKQQIENTFILVESLLDWFRSQQKGFVFHPMERDLGHVVQQNLRLLHVRSEGKHIQIVSDIPDRSYVYADKEMLDLIIRNLLSNAIKFTDFGGRITLEASMKGNQMIVAISDTGEGISPDQARTLLKEPYPSSSVGTAGERGVGLGLALCREFVRLNGGEIWFDSAPEQGSTFYFSIPASTESLPARALRIGGEAV
ncbi:sensor histidine kinase [Paenibacillus sp. YIM B09110]|uniref:sensor histidine kinase n=1 Tax=Paenibacillus sp. YIM B09110 TaxID=3126102 RepID=UPI00301BD2B9